MPVLLYAGRPLVVALFPLAALDILAALEFVHARARTAAPPLATGLAAAGARILPYFIGRSPAETADMPASRVWLAVNATCLRYGALVEVSIGVLLLVELLGASRNLMLLVMWWQLLQFRYMTSQDSKDAFALVDRRLTGVTQHRLCPAIVAKGYGALRGFLGRQVEMPDPAAAPAAGGGGLAGLASRCTIM
jgi:hypothetical protein